MYSYICLAQNLLFVRFISRKSGLTCRSADSSENFVTKDTRRETQVFAHKPTRNKKNDKETRDTHGLNPLGRCRLLEQETNHTWRPITEGGENKPGQEGEFTQICQLLYETREAQMCWLSTLVWISNRADQTVELLSPAWVCIHAVKPLHDQYWFDRGTTVRQHRNCCWPCLAGCVYELWSNRDLIWFSFMTSEKWRNYN